MKQIRLNRQNTTHFWCGEKELETRRIPSSNRIGDDPPFEAPEWAKSALRDYEACGNAGQEIVDTLKLLERIESGHRASPPPS